MGHSVELKSLIDSLIQRSEAYELEKNSDRKTALDALEDLNHLSSLTEEAFAGMPPEPEPEPILVPIIDEDEDEEVIEMLPHILMGDSPPASPENSLDRSAPELNPRLKSSSTAPIQGPLSAASLAKKVPTGTTPPDLTRPIASVASAAAAAKAALTRPDPRTPATPRSRAAATRSAGPSRNEPAVTVSSKYQDSPALRDRSVLDALLQFHSQNQPARGVKGNSPQTAGTNAAAPPSTAAKPHSQAQGPGGRRDPSVPPQFRPAEIPVVDSLQRKEPPRKAIRSSEPTAPVLRARTLRSE